MLSLALGPPLQNPTHDIKGVPLRSPRLPSQRSPLLLIPLLPNIQHRLRHQRRVIRRPTRLRLHQNLYERFPALRVVLSDDARPLLRRVVVDLAVRPP